MIKFPQKKYQVIVVDPPWPIKKISRQVRPNQVIMDYPLMSIDEVLNLPVSEISDASGCWCFLWSIQKYLFSAKEILEKWGFKYLLTMVWEKTYGISNGMPLYGFRWNAEFILVGYIGKIELWPKQKLIPTVFQAENIRHSQKPDKFYDMISFLGQPRIDIFARKVHDGYDAWGDEIL